jgi:2-haloacid dehalogenase
MTWDTVSFDCYGTLVDWESGIARAFEEAAARDGIGLVRDEIIAAYHQVEPKVEAGAYRPYREVLNETALRVAERLGWPLTPRKAGFLAESLPDWPVFEDTRPALERLKSRFRIAILSNVDDDLLSETIERISVEFDWTVTAQQTRSYKPAHGHFREAIRRVEGNRERLLHAARSWFHDMRPATELGLSAVWVNRGGDPAGDDARPVHVVADLSELADWLEEHRTPNTSSTKYSITEEES